VQLGSLKMCLKIICDQRRACAKFVFYAKLAESCTKLRQRDADWEADEQFQDNDFSIAALSVQFTRTTPETFVAYATAATATSSKILRKLNSSVTETQSHFHFASAYRRQSKLERITTYVFAIPFRYRKASTLLYFRRFQPRFTLCRTKCGQSTVAKLQKLIKINATLQERAQSKSTVSDQTALIVDSADTSWSNTNIETNLAASVIYIFSKQATTRLVA
jgi:hypothetical protein